MRISDWSSDVCSSDLSKSKSKEQQTGEQQQQRTIRYKQQHNGAHILQCEQATAMDRRSSNCQSLAEWNASHLFIACNIVRSGGKFEFVHCILGRSGFFRSDEHTSELQSLMRISYAVFFLKKKK